MKTLDAFRRGDGAHCGLTDWYPEKEAALEAALKARAPFDTGWYSSKKEIASARIWSLDGKAVRAEVCVSDDFDTEGRGTASTIGWTLEAVAGAVSSAWAEADQDREDNENYIGFSIHDPKGSWIETYLVNGGDFDAPTGDYYYWWGWQHDEKDDVGVPHPDIPLAAVRAFETFAGTFREEYGTLTVEGWTIRPWRQPEHARHTWSADHAED